MSTAPRSPILSKRLLLTCLVEAALLAVSVYGLWLASHPPLAGTGEELASPLMSLALFGIVPLAAFVFIAIAELSGMGDIMSSAGFQQRIDGLQKRLNAQDDFFHSINNDTPSTLTIYTDENEYWFINASAARE